MYFLIDKLILHNIRCFDDLELDFSKGTNIITGENGAGKSSILLAIGFALFGSKYLIGSSIEQNDLIKWGEVHGSITLDFSCSNGIYQSSYKLSDRTTSWIVKEKNTGKILSKTINESRLLIYKILGNTIDENIFKNALCSSQGELTVLLDAKPSERKNQINKILGLTEYDNTSKQVVRIVNKLHERKERLEQNIKIREERDLDLVKIQNKYNNLIEEEKKLQLEIQNLNKIITLNLAQLQEEKKLKNELFLIESKLSHRQKDFKDNQEAQMSVNEILKDAYSMLGVQFRKQSDLSSYSQMKDTNNKEILDKLSNIQKIITQYNSYENQIISLRKELKQVEIEKRNNDKSILELLDGSSIDTLQKELEEKKNKFLLSSTRLNAAEEQVRSITSQLKRLDEDNKNDIEENQDFEKVIFDKFAINYKDLKQKEIVENENQKKLINDGHEFNKIQQNLMTLKGKLSSELELSKKTINLLREIGSTSSCPTCFREFTQQNQKELLPLHQKKIEQINEELNSVNSQLEENKMLTDNNTAKISKQEKLIKSIELFISKIPLYEKRNMRIEARNLESNNLKKSLHTVQKEINEINKMNNAELKKRVNHLDETIQKLHNRKLTESSLEGRIKNIQSSINKISIEIERIELETHKKMEQKLQREKIELNTELSVLNEKIIPNFKLYRTLISQEIDLGDQIQSLQKKRNNLSDRFIPSNFEKMEKEIEELNAYFGSLNGRYEALKNTIIPNEKKNLDFAKEQDKLIKKEKNTLDIINSKLPTAKKISTILKALPGSIMGEITDVVSYQITQTMKRLLPNRGFDKVIFKNDGDLHLVYNGLMVDRNAISGGEKTVIGIALRLALTEYVAPINFMILDEPTNHLDSQRIDEFIEIVDRDDLFSGSNGQLIIVTHRDEFNRNANKTIKVIVQPNLKRSINVNKN